MQKPLAKLTYSNLVHFYEIYPFRTKHTADRQ